jgi:Zn-dependent protease
MLVLTFNKVFRDDISLGERLYRRYRVSYLLSTNEVLAWIVGTIAVTVAWIGLDLFRPWAWGYWEKWSLIGIVLAFVLHEMAHRTIASLGGFRARFVISPPWLLVTFVSAVLPIKVIAPGYVEVATFTPVSPLRFKWLLYSVAGGPATNIVISLISLMLYKLEPGALAIAMINAYVAFFNLLPIPPLDGSKVLNTDKKLWALLFIASVALLAVSYWI